MREDMDKQIVERPRRGSRFGALWVRRNRRRSKQQDLEAAPKQVSMGAERQYGYDEKELSERLGPLLRFLHRNVGRPWAKVYSEIRARIRLDAAVQLHIMQHLLQEVNTDVIIGPTGHPMIPVSFRRGEDGVFGYVRYYSIWRYPSFYVHPVNGLLCRAPREISNDKKPVKTLRLPRTAKAAAAVAVDDQIFVKVGGVWRHAVFAPLPDDMTWARFSLWCRLHPADAPFDPLLGVALGAADAAAIDGVYHGSRRTRCVAIGAPLGQREIRSFDLR